MKQHLTFIIFLTIWLIINFVTAFSVELYGDEAYYWMYTQFMDWGYFDHPPGVAVTIWLGSFLGKTEIAVRLFTVLATAVSITLIYWLTKPKNVLVFCTSIFSFLVLHLIGFVALPDTPFFLSAILFLLSYRYFLKDDSLKNQLLLSLTAALMIYCK
jgi:4-amino-4-deoxy-L-arabinose transferase-like glycosyltransferase